MRDKKLIVFDLDGTLTESKSLMDKEMASLFSQLLQTKKVAIISGSGFQQFQKQFLSQLNCPHEQLKNLFLFPTCSTSFYKFENEWNEIYSHNLEDQEKQIIKSSILKMFDDVGFTPKLDFNEIVEDRGSQITFSALGQNAPFEKKKIWDPDLKKRKKMKSILDSLLPNHHVKVGGSTSLDITRKGIDKAYGIEQIEKHLGIEKHDMVFLGDALFEGGNDFPVRQAGVSCVHVSSPEHTKQIIKSLLIEN